jgi:hypothetical protein
MRIDSPFCESFVVDMTLQECIPDGDFTDTDRGPDPQARRGACGSTA